MPNAGARPTVALTVDLATIRRQVAVLARRGVDVIDDYLTQIVQFLDNGQSQDALAVLEAVSEEVIDADAVGIFLHEGLIDDAIAAIGPHSYESKVIAVMDAAIQSRPEWVIQAAQERAESIMNAGKADRYGGSVVWLRHAKEAYVTSGRQNAWTSYLAQIRDKHGRKWKLMGLLKGI